METYQIALYNLYGDTPCTEEIIWDDESDEAAIGHARQVMADWPRWIGSLNRWERDRSGRRRGGVWLGDIHDAGQRVDTVNDGFDVIVNCRSAGPR